MDKNLSDFKIMLNRYNTIIVSEGKIKHPKILSDGELKNKKNQLNNSLKANDKKIIIDILLSIRIQAIELPKQSRKELVEKLINIDFIDAEEEEGCLNLLDSSKLNEKNAIISLLSIIVGDTDGVRYLTRDLKEFKLIQKIWKVT